MTYVDTLRTDFITYHENLIQIHNVFDVSSILLKLGPTFVPNKTTLKCRHIIIFQITRAL